MDNGAGHWRAQHSVQEPVCSCGRPEEEPVTKGLREEEVTLNRIAFLDILLATRLQAKETGKIGTIFCVYPVACCDPGPGKKSLLDS